MIEYWQSTFRSILIEAQDAFLLPGDLVLNVLLSDAPLLMNYLGVDPDGNSQVISAVFAILFWLLVVWALWILLGLARRIVWYARSAIHTVAFRIALGFHNLRFGLHRAFQRLTLSRVAGKGSELAEVHFNDLDVAILRSSGRLGPGFATSAPDLAAELSLRPAQVQQSLDKLRKCRMLDIATGSSDGYHNYHVSRSGFLFLKSALRHARHT